MDYKSEKHSKFWDRRGFLKKSAAALMAGIIGTELVFAEFLPKGVFPIPFLGEGDPFSIDGKDPNMIVLNDRPWNLETPAHLLDDKITPADKMFVRNNGKIPNDIQPENWELEIAGESIQNPMTFSLIELKSMFKTYTYQLTLECGGNGRAEFDPPAKGNQWGLGAVSCASWTGIRLKDLLNKCGVKSDAVYVGYEGADIHLSGDSSKRPISRGVPLSKAMELESLIAWQMNGEDIPLYNGFPLRLVIGGWPASTSGKWLNKILVRNKVHDGAKMGGKSYRVPCETVAPGTEVADEDMCIIESMPVKALITFPKSGAMIKDGTKFQVRGHAWAGDLKVTAMHVSIDFGKTWKKVRLEEPSNRLAWQHWNAEIDFPQTGYYEVWARATDANGSMQPMLVPGWNPRGYLNNACHRIAVKVS